MPVKAVDKNGKILTFDTEREARLFGTEPISDEAAGIPKRPDYVGLTNPATGQLHDRFSMKDVGGDIRLNTQGLEEIRRRALETGPSKWETLALGKQAEEEIGALDEATRAGKGAEAGALSNLAMFGGVSGGERERIGYGSARDIAESRQGVGREGRIARAGINLASEEQKAGYLKGLPGMELAALEPEFKKAELQREKDRFNLSALRADQAAKTAWDLGSYEEMKKKYGAGEEAKATEAAGGGTHICTAVHKEYRFTDEDLNKLDKFREDAMEYFPEVFKFYLTRCETLIPRIKEQGGDMGMLRPFVNLVFRYMEKFGHEYALDFYADYTEELVKLYMPEFAKEAEQVRAITASN